MRPTTFAIGFVFVLCLGALQTVTMLYFAQTSEIAMLQAKVAALTAEKEYLQRNKQMGALGNLLMPVPNHPIKVQPHRPPATLPPALQMRFNNINNNNQNNNNNINNNINNAIAPRNNPPPDPPPQQQPQPVQVGDGRVPVLVIAYDRAHYLQQALTSIHKYLPERNYVIVSQDGWNTQVTQVVKSWPNVQHIQHDNSYPITFRSHNIWEKESYYRIAQHYAWAFQQVFSDPNVQEVIILEEDLEISEDFFSYMAAMSVLIDTDPTLWTASAWNDNGYAEYINDAHKLYRSDFFPGLGWLLKRRIWMEFPSFTDAYWDDWLREAKQRKGRQCIRPEISRTLTFGKDGVSQGQFFDTHLSRIRLNRENIDWQNTDLSYLLKDAYDANFRAQVRNAQIVGLSNIGSYPEVGSCRIKCTKATPKNTHLTLRTQSGNVRVMYNGYEDFKRIAQMMHIMDDEKSGVPRTAYYGVVTLRVKPDTFLHIVPLTF